jgi:hypothetical protein
LDSYQDQLVLLSERVWQTYSLESVIDSMASTQLSRYREYLESSATPPVPESTYSEPTFLAEDVVSSPQIPGFTRPLSN